MESSRRLGAGGSISSRETIRLRVLWSPLPLHQACQARTPEEWAALRDSQNSTKAIFTMILSSADKTPDCTSRSFSQDNAHRAAPRAVSGKPARGWASSFRAFSGWQTACRTALTGRAGNVLHHWFWPGGSHQALLHASFRDEPAC